MANSWWPFPIISFAFFPVIRSMAWLHARTRPSRSMAKVASGSRSMMSDTLHLGSASPLWRIPRGLFTSENSMAVLYALSSPSHHDEEVVLVEGLELYLLQDVEIFL